MARFDLKNTTIRFVDGYSNTAAVNDTPANGDTDLDIDTVVGVDASGDGVNTDNKIIPIATRFTVVGSSEKYTVTDANSNAQLVVDIGGATAGTFTVTIDGNTSAAIAYDALEAAIQSAIDAITGVTAGDFSVTRATDIVTITALDDGAFEDLAIVMSADLGSLTGGAPTQTQTQAGAVTWNVTFTPALATADGIPADDAVITFTGRTLEIKVGDGDVSFTENREMLYELDRGNLDTVREGDQQPVDVSMDIVWENLAAVSGADTPVPWEVLHRDGAAASWKSSAADTCEPFCIDIEINHLPPCGATGEENLTMPEFRWESLDGSAQDAQISMTGRCNSTEIIRERVA